ncbi:MAG: cadmium-translocating P-type ATPase, partial [Anaerolineae bacterium]|nr:cadmium-translocating P-type ATPase [Anaerolineae bacterium]
MSLKTYKIGNMDCAHCAQEVETGVRRLQGVEKVDVDFATGKMMLVGDVPFDTLRTRVEALGKTIDSPDATAKTPQPAQRGGVIGFWDYLLKRTETRLALIGGGLIVITLIGSLLFPSAAAMTGWLYTVAMLIALYPIAKSGLNALRINHEFNINMLMAIAAIGAIAIGEYLEGATVIFLFAIGEALEGYTADRARDSLRSLMDLAPAQATRIFRAGELLPVYNEETVPVEQLAVDDVILVRPGDRIAMDGTVVQGSSAVNQAPITGESIPVHKESGAEVFAGTINGDGVLQVRLTRLAADNTLNRIIQLVEEAQGVRAPSQRLIDRFAHYYTPAVTVIALLVALIPPLIFNQPFYDVPGEAHGWLYRALTLLVIACPCALVISTPVTIISAITAAARRGVLIKGGAHLESLGTVRAIAFDKTGTLTYGKPMVTQMRSVDCETGAACSDCDDVLALAAAVEKRSAHPLAQAIVRAAEERDLHTSYTPAESVTVLNGRGVQGRINGKTITVGSHN